MYLDRLLESTNGERACLVTRPHWFQAVGQGARGLLLFACGLAVLLFGEQIAFPISALLPRVLPASNGGGGAEHAPVVAGLPEMGVDLHGVLSWAGIVLALVGMVLLGWALLCRHFTEYAITVSAFSAGSGEPPGPGGRIIKVQGVLSRRTIAVPLGKVNDLVIDEPLLGRLLGWGHVDIETGNDYVGDRMEYLPDPQRFQVIWKTLLYHDLSHVRTPVQPTHRSRSLPED